MVFSAIEIHNREKQPRDRRRTDEHRSKWTPLDPFYKKEHGDSLKKNYAPVPTSLKYTHTITFLRRKFISIHHKSHVKKEENNLIQL